MLTNLSVPQFPLTCNGANDSTYLIWVEEMIKWLTIEKSAEHRVSIRLMSSPPSFSQNLFLFYHGSGPISSENNNYLMVIS